MLDTAEEIIESLRANINALLVTAGFARLIPEVGSNFVMCLPKATALSHVAGLTGRIILVRGAPKAVGEVDFGWAPFMGRVILKAHEFNEQIRSAISLRRSDLIIEACRRAGFQVIGFRLSKNQTIPDCMTLAALNKLKFVPEVLFDWGAHGIEPLVVVFASKPDETRKRVQAILKEMT